MICHAADRVTQITVRSMARYAGSSDARLTGRHRARSTASHARPPGSPRTPRPSRRRPALPHAHAPHHRQTITPRGAVGGLITCRHNSGDAVPVAGRCRTHGGQVVSGRSSGVPRQRWKPTTRPPQSSSSDRSESGLGGGWLARSAGRHSRRLSPAPRGSAGQREQHMVALPADSCRTAAPTVQSTAGTD